MNLFADIRALVIGALAELEARGAEAVQSPAYAALYGSEDRSPP